MKHLPSASSILTTLLAFGGAVAALPAQEWIQPPTVRAKFPLDTAGGGLEVPYDPRLEMPDDEGTIEFWFTPQWQTKGQPEYHCVVVNGSTVRRRRAPDSEDFATFFDVRYAVYVTRSAIVFQSGSALKVVANSEFNLETFGVGEECHVTVATKGDRTTICLKGTHAIQLDVGYGDAPGARTFVGGLPPDAVGVVQTPDSSFHDGERWVDTMKVEDASLFGPFRGQLGGVRLWSRHLGERALSPKIAPDGGREPAPITFYGQAHAERDLAFTAAGKGELDVYRADLIALSEFAPPPPGQPRMRLADPFGGIWLDALFTRPEIQSKPWLLDLEPMTILQPCPVIVLVPEPNAGSSRWRYKVYVDGEWGGDMVPNEADPERPYTFEDVEGASYQVGRGTTPDQLRIDGVPSALVQAGHTERESVTLMRDKAITKGNYTDIEDAFTVSLQERNVPFLRRSFDLLRLDPNRYWEANARVLGVDKFVFEKPGRYDFQLVNKVKLPWACYINNVPHGEGGVSSVTATTEREELLAIRAKFGIQGGKPGVTTAGIEGEGQWQEELKKSSTTATTLANSYDKLNTIMNDMVSVRLSPEFVAAVRQLATGAVSPDQFIADWGTHYARGMTTGALAYRKRTFQENTIEELTSYGFDLSAFIESGNASDKNAVATSPGGVKAEVGGGTTVTDKLKEMDVLEEIDWSYVGGSAKDPEQSSGVSLDNSAPISFDLRPLHELLSPAYFQDPAIYVGARNRLRDALLAYLSADEPSDESPFRDEQSAVGMTFRVKVSRFICESLDSSDFFDDVFDVQDGNNKCEFFGRVTALAYADVDGKRKWKSGGKEPERPTELWNNTKQPDSEWREKDWTDSFEAKDGAFFEVSRNESRRGGGAGVPFDPMKVGMPSQPHGPGLQLDSDGASLAYAVDPAAAEGFGVEMKFVLKEDDDDEDWAEVFTPVTKTLRLSDFASDGTIAGPWATDEHRRRHWVELKEKDGEGTVKFAVETWVETGSGRWFNRDRSSVFGPLAEALRRNVNATRARSATSVLDSNFVEAADVLAYFPRDLDGLRRPGARYFTGTDEIPALDLSCFSVQFDLQTGVKDLDLTLSPASGEFYDDEVNFYFQSWKDETSEQLQLVRGRVNEQSGSDLQWNARLMIMIPPGGIAAAVAALDAKEPGHPELPILEYWQKNGIIEEVQLDLDPDDEGKQRWLTIGLSFDSAQGLMYWHVLDRETMTTLTSGKRDFYSASELRHGRADLLLRNVPACVKRRALTARSNWVNGAHENLDEIYVLREALTATQLKRLAEEAREPAPIVVEPVAYWPFDGKRVIAPAMRVFPGAHGRVRDDALMLTPSVDRLTQVGGLDLRDLTMQFDFRFTDASRTLTFGDDLGLFEIEIRRTMDQHWAALRFGKGGGWVRVTDFDPAPYVWNRLAVSFDGLYVAMALDDGSGFVRTKGFTCSTLVRDALAKVAIEQAGKDISWHVSAEYNHPGTRLEAAPGYFPANEDELTRIDEVRFWRGSMNEKQLAKSMTEPRQFAPPARDLALLVYQDYAPAAFAKPDDDADLLAELVSTDLRANHATDAPTLEAGAAIDVEEAALSLDPGASVRVECKDLALSDFTLHVDFRPGDGALRLRNGPFAFECVGGRPRILVDTGDASGLRYDAAFGDRLAADEWHKLVLGIDAWRSRLTAILDGESLGAVPLSRPVVDALRAADADPRAWRIERSEDATGAALVDELLILRPALGAADLNDLAGRLRKPGGQSAPTMLVRARGLGELDYASSALRDGDMPFADDLAAYYPFADSFEERSGRGGAALAAAAAEGEAAARETAWRIDDEAACSEGADGEPLTATVPDLDLRGYTASMWFQVDDLPGTLVHLPGVTVRMEEGGRQLREYLDEAERRGLLTAQEVARAQSSDDALLDLMKKLVKEGGKAMGENPMAVAVDPQQTMRAFVDRAGLAISLALLRVTRNIFTPEVVLRSVDGRILAVPLRFALEPRAIGAISKTRVKEADELELAMERRMLDEGTELVLGAWHHLVLALDVASGELRGAIDGRQLATIQLPKGFELRSPVASTPREVRLGRWRGRIDELLFVNRTPLPSSNDWRMLTSRPRRPGPAVEWELREGYVLPEREYQIVSRRGQLGATVGGEWRAIFSAVPGATNRYVVRSMHDVREWIEDTPSTFKIVDGKQTGSPGTGHWKTIAAKPTLTPRLVGGRVRLEWASPKEPTIWELRPVEGGGANDFSLHCVSPGAWNGWSAAVDWLNGVPHDREMQAPIWGKRALELKPDVQPWTFSR